eukprot:1184083-Prorocentrum_minimum.AAC.4
MDLLAPANGKRPRKTGSLAAAGQSADIISVSCNVHNSDIIRAAASSYCYTGSRRPRICSARDDGGTIRAGDDQRSSGKEFGHGTPARTAPRPPAGMMRRERKGARPG